MAYTWNEGAGRFVDAQGRFISERVVRDVVDRVADLAASRLDAATARMLAGDLSLASWQAEAQAMIRTAHLAAATIAHGGAERMTPARYGAVGRRLRDEYGYLRGMAEDIASGRQPLDGSLPARARQYGQAARVTFEREYGRDQQGRGFRWEKNVLQAGESCSGCRAESARGWVPIGTLMPVGSRLCRSNCRCRFVFSREAAGVAA